MSDIGRISDDGRWRWDGQAWQPVAVEAPAPPPVTSAVESPLPVAMAYPPPAMPAAPMMSMAPTSQKRRGWIGYAVVGVVALIIGSVCGGVIGSSANSNNAANAANHSASSPSAAASTAASTTSAHSEASAYADVVVRDSAKLEAALNTFSTDCGNADTSKCRTDSQTVSAQSQAFLDDIGKLTVPACLSTANEQLSTSLELLIDASNDVVAGIDANDASKITDGANLIDLATTHLNKVSGLVDSNRC